MHENGRFWERAAGWVRTLEWKARAAAMAVAGESERLAWKRVGLLTAVVGVDFPSIEVHPEPTPAAYSPGGRRDALSQDRPRRAVLTAGEKACPACGKGSAEGQDSCLWCGVWLEPLDAARVPQALTPLLPPAQVWGINDDGYRDEAVDRATTEDLHQLASNYGLVDEDALNAWLTGPEADEPRPSREYLAVTCLTMASDLARVKLERRAPQH